jgi:hypothetical protein
MGCSPHPVAMTSTWPFARAAVASDEVTTADFQGASPVIIPLYCCVTGRGGAIGSSFVEVGIAVSGSGDEGDVEPGWLLVGVGVAICGVDCAVTGWVAGGALGVSRCWLHPHSDKPTSALAATI